VILEDVTILSCRSHRRDKKSRLMCHMRKDHQLTIVPPAFRHAALMRLAGAATQLWRSVRARAPADPLQTLGAGASIALLAVAAFALHDVFSQLELAEIIAAMKSATAAQLVAAALLTALSYGALAGYDFAALTMLGARVPAPAVMLASFGSYAVSFTLGFPVVTAPAVRYWIYARHGLTAVDILKVTVIGGVTFWLGMVAALGLGAVVGAGPLALVDHLPPLANAAIGLAALALLAGYCVWTARAPRRIRLRGHMFELPGPRAALTQIGLGLADLCCAAGALYVLFPDHGLGFPGFLAVYVFACLLGVASHAPGGIGVFEAAMLHAAPAAGPESTVAALLLFRVVYYFAPFALAAALLWAGRGRRRP